MKTSNIFGHTCTRHAAHRRLGRLIRRRRKAQKYLEHNTKELQIVREKIEILQNKLK